MRLPSATECKQPAQPPRNAAAGGVAQVVSSILAVVVQAAPSSRPGPERADELPSALDERVRLVGEW